MISDQIRSLVEQTKQHPNGLRRNKIVSHLEDAFAHAVLLEREEFIGSPDLKSRVKSAFAVDELPSTECICPAPGVISSACRARVHKLS